MHKGSGAVVAETAFGVSDATRGLKKLDLREQELKDMEVARMLQEEEIKVRRSIMFCSFVQKKCRDAISVQDVLILEFCTINLYDCVILFTEVT